MDEQGSIWGMRREVERRAEHAVHEVISTVMRLNPFIRSMDVILEFDELRFEAVVEHNGAGPVLSDSPPTAEELVTEEGIAALSGFMIYSYRGSGPGQNPGEHVVPHSIAGRPLAGLILVILASFRSSPDRSGCS